MTAEELAAVEPTIRAAFSKQLPAGARRLATLVIRRHKSAVSLWADIAYSDRTLSLEMLLDESDPAYSGQLLAQRVAEAYRAAKAARAL